MSSMMFQVLMEIVTIVDKGNKTPEPRVKDYDFRKRGSQMVGDLTPIMSNEERKIDVHYSGKSVPKPRKTVRQCRYLL
jgi:hypothetical protein